MTPEEITKLAEEYAVEVTKGMAKTLDEPSCLLNETKRATKEYITDFMQWLLRTHCIVSNEEVRKVYYNANHGDFCDRFENGYNVGVRNALTTLFDPDTFDETINDGSMKAIRKSDGKVIEVKPQRFMEQNGAMYAPSELDFNVEESEEVTVDGWVARDDKDVCNGELFLYPIKPRRKRHWFALPEDAEHNAAILLDAGLFPNLTFENSPMEVSITIKPKKKQ